MRYHLTAFRIAITKTTNKNCWRGCGGKEILLQFGGTLNQCPYNGKHVDVPQKTKTNITTLSRNSTDHISVQNLT